MKMFKFVILAVISLSACANGYAQSTRTRAEDPRPELFPTLYPIDWRSDRATWDHPANRAPRELGYTIAVHPYHLLKGGLKVDLEKKHDKPGKWLQMGLMGYLTPRYSRSDHGGWENLASGYKEFGKLTGAGFSLAHKTMLGHNGFHYNYGILYNFYHVDHTAFRYVPFTENGLPMYEYRPVEGNTNFHQPAVFVNVGKHMALGRHAFVDAFIGMGYMRSFYSGSHTRYDDYLSFGYRGLYFNAGLRLGVVWGKNRR